MLYLFRYLICIYKILCSVIIVYRLVNQLFRYSFSYHGICIFLSFYYPRYVNLWFWLFIIIFGFSFILIVFRLWWMILLFSRSCFSGFPELLDLYIMVLVGVGGWTLVSISDIIEFQYDFTWFNLPRRRIKMAPLNCTTLQIFFLCLNISEIAGLQHFMFRQKPYTQQSFFYSVFRFVLS